MSKIEGLPESKLVKHQPHKKASIKNEDGSRIQIEMRYDDDCGNSHNSFSITGAWWEEAYDVQGSVSGCIHDLIEKYAPQYAKYIKWHLCSSDGPMGYIANATYFAGNRDCWGRAPGDVSEYKYGIHFNGSKVPHFIPEKLYRFIERATMDSPHKFKVVERPYDGKDSYDFDPKYSLEGFGDSWYGAPFDNITEANAMALGLNTEKFKMVKLPTRFSKGKEREFDAARRAAIWPEATDEQLSLPKAELTKLLEDRLPAVMEEFKAAMEEIGFVY